MAGAPNPDSRTIPDPSTKKPLRAWRRVPVSLRLFGGMLALVFIAGAVWTGIRVYRLRTVIREIQQANGTAEFESDAPRWLHRWVNDDWLTAFDRISEVTLPFSETLDADTKCLLAVRPLPELVIEGGPSIHELISAGRLDEVRSVLARHRILLFSRDPGSRETPLHVAMYGGDFDIQKRAELVTFLLEQGSEVDAPDLGGFTPLYSAAHPATVKLLLDHSASLAVGGPNDAILDEVASVFTRCGAERRENWLEIARLLRGRGAQCNLVSACCLNDLPRVRQLLRSARPALIQDAFRAAATWGRTDIVKVLLTHGADPNEVHNQNPVAFDAIRHPDVLQILFDHDVNARVTCHRYGLDGWTLLHEAAREGAVESARLVLDRGIPVDSRDADGQTPLHVAAISSNVAVVELLLDRRANVNAQASSGITAISFAASDSNWWGMLRTQPKVADQRAVIELLLAAGAPLDVFTAIALGRTAVAGQILAENPELSNSRDCQKQSPLNRAVNLDQSEMVQVLLVAGADIDAKGDYEESTALHRAAYLGRIAIAKILIAHHADVNATDGYGQTPLHRAARELKSELVRLLLAAGTKPDARDENGQTPIDHARGSRSGTLNEAEQREQAETIRLLSEPEESVRP